MTSGALQNGNVIPNSLQLHKPAWCSLENSFTNESLIFFKLCHFVLMIEYSNIKSWQEGNYLVVFFHLTDSFCYILAVLINRALQKIALFCTKIVAALPDILFIALSVVAALTSKSLSFSWILSCKIIFYNIICSSDIFCQAILQTIQHCESLWVGVFKDELYRGVVLPNNGHWLNRFTL